MRQDATTENLTGRFQVNVAPFPIEADYSPEEFCGGNGGIAAVQGISLGKEACAVNSLGIGGRAAENAMDEQAAVSLKQNDLSFPGVFDFAAASEEDVARAYPWEHASAKCAKADRAIRADSPGNRALRF